MNILCSGHGVASLAPVNICNRIYITSYFILFYFGIYSVYFRNNKSTCTVYTVSVIVMLQDPSNIIAEYVRPTRNYCAVFN